MIALDPGAIERWRSLVAEAPPELVLPTDRPDRRDGDPGSETFDLFVPAEPTYAAVRAAADIWLAAFIALLHRYSGEARIATAVDVPAEEPSLALVCAEVSAELTFGELMRAVSRDLDVARADRSVARDALPELRAALAPMRPGVAHAMFAWHHEALQSSAMALANVDLGRFGGGAGETPASGVRYRSGVFESSAVRRLVGHLQVLLGAAVRDPGQRIVTLPLLTREELDTRTCWNDTARPYRSDASLVELLRERAAASPDAVAVELEGSALTYAELDERANRLAGYLSNRGVGRETLVALLLERSLDMIVAVLGVQRAGGAYIPIDSDYPRERVEFMLSDAAPALVLVHESLRAKLPERLPGVISLDGERSAIAAAPSTPPRRMPDTGDLAYVIYTSGSTGRPKGVQIEHRQVVNFLKGMEAAVQLQPGHTLVGVAPLAFDISGLDMYLPLTSGARLVVAPREVAGDPKALLALMERVKVSHMQATPATWRMLVEAGWRGDPGLTILCGGEALPTQLAGQLLERAREVWNLYGPTEATIWATMQRLRANESVTIGRPMANVTAHVVDAALQPVPVGVPGELFLGGAGIARGYLKRPELTAERFVPDPFAREPGARMYRTGDVVRYCSDGRIDYLGRADFQVKLRGYRIELGEVEAALSTQTDVRAAVAMVREDAPGEQRLVAYVVLRYGSSVAPPRLRRALLERLPRYMVPDAIVLLEELPLNTNGKVDRAKLPAPGRRPGGGEGYVTARSALERRLVAIWEEVLDIRPVGITDDFFDLGANSLAAARVFDRIERELGAKLPLSPLFAAPTIEKLAQLIERGRVENRYPSLVPIQPRGERTPIFWVHGGAGTILHFQPLARALGEKQPFYGFQMQGLYGDAPPHLSVESMAAHYISELRKVQPHGPYALAGYCFGALVAFEMAQQLERGGERVALLATVNGPTPQYIVAHRVWLGKRWALEVFWHLFRARLYALYRRPLPDAWRELTIRLICNGAEARYRPRVYDGTMLLFKAANLYDEPTLGWADFVTRGVDVVEVPGEQAGPRSTMREPHVRHISVRLAEELERAFAPELRS